MDYQDKCQAVLETLRPGKHSFRVQYVIDQVTRLVSMVTSHLERLDCRRRDIYASGGTYMVPPLKTFDDCLSTEERGFIDSLYKRYCEGNNESREIHYRA